jgi:hypothetical protein
MNRVLIMKILIELTISTPVVSIANLIIDTFFHMVNAGAFPRRSFFELFFPENDSTLFFFWEFTLFPQGFVALANTPQRSVKAACCAMIITPAESTSNDARLHPDAGACIVC